MWLSWVLSGLWDLSGREMIFYFGTLSWLLTIDHGPFTRMVIVLDDVTCLGIQIQHTPVIHCRHGLWNNIHDFITELSKWSALQWLSKEVSNHLAGGTVLYC